MRRVTNHNLMNALDKIIFKTMDNMDICDNEQKRHKEIIKHLKSKNSDGYPLIFTELDSALQNWRSVQSTTAKDPEKYVLGTKLTYRVKRIFQLI